MNNFEFKPFNITADARDTVTIFHLEQNHMAFDVPILIDHVQQANAWSLEHGGGRSSTSHCPAALALRAYFPHAEFISVGIELCRIEDHSFRIDPLTALEIKRWCQTGQFYPRNMSLTLIRSV